MKVTSMKSYNAEGVHVQVEMPNEAKDEYQQQTTDISIPLESMNFASIFTFQNLYKAARKCLNGVRWKASVQNIEYKIVDVVTSLRDELLNGKYKMQNSKVHTIHERGKCRKITPIHIRDRIVQKCLCDNYLTELLSRTFIYDNGACLKDKGVRFAITRFKHHIHKFMQQNNVTDGYILKFDIQHFFDSINRDILIDMYKKIIHDDNIIQLIAHITNHIDGIYGIGLGSQISQLSASLYMSTLDHIMKDQLHIKYYGRYMDDGYIISTSKKELHDLINVIKDNLDDIKLNLHPNKTQIYKLSLGVTYLKRRVVVKPDMKILIYPHKTTYKRYKRKRCKMIKLKVSQTAIDTLDQCYSGYLKEFNRRNSYVYNKNGSRYIRS